MFSTGPHIKLLQQLEMGFIIGAKPGNLGFLFDWVKALVDFVPELIKNIVDAYLTRSDDAHAHSHGAYGITSAAQSLPCRII